MTSLQTMNTSFFNEMIASISERGRALLDLGIGRNTPATGAGLAERCQGLVSSQGEASGVALAADILHCYNTLPDDEKLAFFKALAHDFGPDLTQLHAAISAFNADASPDHINRLHRAAEPKRQELVRRLNLAPHGTARLVAMRADLLRFLRTEPDLKCVDVDVQHLFAAWFNRGFLVLKRISWDTPAAILEKIIRYEAVHEIKDWDDLRRRIDAPDRRLYAFFHPALNDEPLIFVQVALTDEIPAAIPPLLAPEREPLALSQTNTATFYSISNCQSGLKGISFGNFLIKQVVEDLLQEIASLKTFVTLSPIPGFMRWLDRERGEPQILALSETQWHMLDQLDDPNRIIELAAESSSQTKDLTTLLGAICATYFVHARDERGRAVDPVARFHLGNGARLERINPAGDLSDKGVMQSAGLMVNYLYDLDDIEKNHEAFANQGDIVATPSVKRSAGQFLRTRS